MIKYVVLERDKEVLNQIKLLMQKDNRFVELASYLSFEDFRTFISVNTVDLVIADIDAEGSKFVDLWTGMEKMPEMIILGSQIIGENANYGKNDLQFVSKPLKDEQFYNAMEKACRKLKFISNDIELSFLFVQVGNKKFKRIEFIKLMCIEADGSYLNLTMADDKKIIVLKRLKDLLAQLPSSMFKQIHRSTIINVNAINTIDMNEVTLTNGQVLSIGKTYKNVFKELVSNS